MCYNINIYEGGGFLKDNVSFLIEYLGMSDENDLCVVNNCGKCNKLQSEDLYPDSEGVIVVHKLDDWSLSGMSVKVLLEVVDRYRDIITKVLVQDYLGDFHEIRNIFETTNLAEYGHYVTMLQVDNSVKRNRKVMDDYKTFDEVRTTFNSFKV